MCYFIIRFPYVLGPPLHPERMRFHDTYFIRHDDRISWLSKSVPFAFLLWYAYRLLFVGCKLIIR